jgi:hypothetical protein
MKLIDRTGCRYGHLIVLRRLELNRHGETMWLCRCDCGTETTAKAGNLQRGKVRSCGCKRAELSQKLPPGEGGFRNLAYNYKLRAKKKGLQFSITDEEFRALTRSNCYYCMQEPSQIYKNGTDRTAYTYNGVDRKDGKLGYTRSNCVPCCGRCNLSKNTMNEAEFINWITRVYRVRVG